MERPASKHKVELDWRRHQHYSVPPVLQHTAREQKLFCHLEHSGKQRDPRGLGSPVCKNIRSNTYSFHMGFLWVNNGETGRKWFVKQNRISILLRKEDPWETLWCYQRQQKHPEKFILHNEIVSSAPFRINNIFCCFFFSHIFPQAFCFICCNLPHLSLPWKIPQSN